MLSENGKARGIVRLYGCGGCGINLAKHFLTISDSRPELADTRVSLIDTSRSNLIEDPDIPEQMVYLLPETDGSGKVRKTNAEEMMRHADPILATHVPGDLNIVVSSTTGGSGSVMGPIIAKKLLDKGKNVVYVAIGGNESARAATNCRDTFKTLDGVVRATKQPLVVIYEDYADGSQRKACDDSVSTAIMFLCRLASRQHHSFDTKDLTNWLRYDLTTTVPAQLSLLDITTSLDAAKTLNYPVSVVSLVKDRENHVAIPSDYNATAYYDINNVPDGTLVMDIHYAITVSETPALMKLISDRIQSWESMAESRPRVSGILGRDDDVTDGFLVL